MNKTTLSVCLPSEVVEQVDIIAKELNVSRSSVVTAMLSITCKWSSSINIKEVLNNGIQN